MSVMLSGLSHFLIKDQHGQNYHTDCEARIVLATNSTVLEMLLSIMLTKTVKCK